MLGDKGFLIKDRLLRPSLVGVSKKAEQKSEESEQKSEESEQKSEESEQKQGK